MFVIYLSGKLIIYSIWCYAGMRAFRSPRLLTVPYVSPLASIVTDTESSSLTATVRQALGLGLFRLAIGLVFGVVAILLGGFFVERAANPFDRKLLAYVLFLIPVRAVEWWITSKVIGKSSPSAPVLLWVVGGVLLSCLADVPTGFAVVDVFGGLC